MILEWKRERETLLIILQQTHGKMDDIEDVDRQSAPTRKSLLVILFTTDSLHPNKDASHRAVAPPKLFLGVKYKMPDEGDRQAVLSSSSSS